MMETEQATGELLKTGIQFSTQPVVSVVIPCFNQAHYLREAIDSALAQSYPHLEVIVVDDGSTDDTLAAASQYRDVAVVHQENRGLPAARNAGLRKSSGDYVAFLDADDRLLPAAIETGLKCFQESPQCGFVFGTYRNVYSDGSPAPSDPPPFVDRDYFLNLLQGNFIGMHATVLYRRTVLEELRGFNENLPACEDYELYLRAARSHPVARHEDLVAEYRQHDNNMSKDKAFMLRTVLQVLGTERRKLTRPEQRAALRNGIRIWRDYYGAPLFEEWKRSRDLHLLARVLRLDPPGTLRRCVRGAARKVLKLKRHLRADDLHRMEPLSRRFGFERGQPIDRYYIESFLAAQARDIRGRVLEIGDDSYSRMLGAQRVTHQDVLNVVPGQPGSTIVADLSDAPHIPSDQFDCIILTQTLHYIFDVRQAVATLLRILKPGGVVLATMPGISQVCRDQEDKNSDCWRFTEASAERLFREAFGAGNVQVETHGNLVAATAFLRGMSASDLKREELDHRDADYPLTITVAARKAEGCA